MNSCSGSDDDGDGGGNGGGNTDAPWDKNRTAKVLVISNLAEGNLFTGTDYSAVANAVKSAGQTVTLLDRTNVSFTANTMSNPGVNVASLSAFVPVFVPIDKGSTSYTGSTVLFDHTIASLEQRKVSENCWLMRKEVNFTSSLKMNFTTVSFNSEAQLDAGVTAIKASLGTSSLVVGVVKRSLASSFQSKVTSSFANGGYMMEMVKNADTGSAYCIYVIGSSKWKFRELTEAGVSGSIKSFLLQVEYLK